MSNFDILKYKLEEGKQPIDHVHHRIEVGKVSYLLLDLITKNAAKEEISKAIDYSKVVINCLKYKLDYKKAFEDLAIKDLQQKYSLHML